MRTTIALDDDLLAQAQRLSGLTEKPALLREALRALIERESARHLARLGGTEPDIRPILRRRSAEQSSTLAGSARASIAQQPSTAD